MPSIDALLKAGENRLLQAGIDAARFDARELLLCALCVEDPAVLYDRTCQIDEAAAQRYEALLQRRADRYPLQYLLGFWEFYGRRFAVRQGVLIPRSDTETLVDAALSFFDSRADISILDLCSGSGVLAITLALSFPASRVQALELSQDALSVLRENVAALCPRVEILAQDVTHWQPVQRYDLIISNPPYIAASDYPALSPEVHCEPEMALTAPEDGMYFYRLLTSLASHALSTDGMLILEAGCGQAQRIEQRMQALCFRDVHTRNDLAGIPRAVCGKAPALGSL